MTCRRESAFFELGGHHNAGQAAFPRVVGQHEVDLMLFVCLFYIYKIKEEEILKLGKLGDEGGRGGFESSGEKKLNIISFYSHQIQGFSA